MLPGWLHQQTRDEWLLIPIIRSLAVDPGLIKGQIRVIPPGPDGPTCTASELDAGSVNCDSARSASAARSRFVSAVYYYTCCHPVVPETLSWPLTWCLLVIRKGQGRIWLREGHAIGHFQNSCHYDSPTLQRSAYLAGWPCSLGPTVPRTPRSSFCGTLRPADPGMRPIAAGSDKAATTAVVTRERLTSEHGANMGTNRTHRNDLER
jgi:hypothetical protein